MTPISTAIQFCYTGYRIHPDKKALNHICLKGYEKLYTTDNEFTLISSTVLSALNFTITEYID